MTKTKTKTKSEHSRIKLMMMLLIDKINKKLDDFEIRLHVLQNAVQKRENQLIRIDERVSKKRVMLRALSRKLNKTGKELEQIKEVKPLRLALKEEQNKTQEMEKRIGKLKNKAKKPLKVKQPVEKSVQKPEVEKEDESYKIKRKYPNLPKNQLERMEIERLVARSLMNNNGGSFYVSQILRKIEGIYPRHIKPNDRITLLNEIKSWIERDPLCKSVKTDDKIQHYTFI